MASRMIKVLYINQSGQGFGDPMEMKERTTIGEFFRTVLDSENEEAYVIRVNGVNVARDTCLLDGDVVSIVTSKQGSAA